MRYLKLIALLLLGLMLAAIAALVTMHFVDELSFYNSAQRQSVTVIQAVSSIDSVSSNVTGPTTWIVESTLEIQYGENRTKVSGTFESRSRTEVTERASWLKSLEGQKANFFLSEKTPDIFTTEIHFPWNTLMGVLLICIISGFISFFAVFEFKNANKTLQIK
jgi:hypothetical protein